MQIITTKIYELNGVVGYACGMDAPTGATVTAQKQILRPAENMILQRISDGELFDSVCLENGDVQSNYSETFEEFVNENTAIDTLEDMIDEVL